MTEYPSGSVYSDKEAETVEVTAEAVDLFSKASAGEASVITSTYYLFLHYSLPIILHESRQYGSRARESDDLCKRDTTQKAVSATLITGPDYLLDIYLA